MREHLGEEFSGVVSAVTSFGVFVTLDAMYVEGLVHITELGGEYFRFDEPRQELRGERTGIRYHLGSRVQVQVSRVDLDGRRIDFRLVHDEGEVTLKIPRSTKDAAGDEVGRGWASDGASDGKSRRRESRSNAKPISVSGGRSRKTPGRDEPVSKVKKSRR